MLKRIVACLDVAGGKVVKGVRFRDHAVVGDIVERARSYCAQGADELVLYDITASPDGRPADRGWVTRVAAEIDIPFCVAGGIRSVAEAAALFEAGADRVSINSPALERPALIDELVAAFGSERVVVGIDSRRDPDGVWRLRRNAGDPARHEDLPRETLAWIAEAVDRGAGEIVLNSIDRDGVRTGYDIEQLRAARAVCPVSLVASGGAGRTEDFLRVFAEAGVDAALAASALHYGLVSIAELKRALGAAGFAVAA